MNTKTQTNIMDQLKGGYPDACKLLNRQALTLENFKALFADEKEAKAFFALHKITTVIEAINEGHEFDWNNDEEWKYYPWWDLETYGNDPAGSGFSLLVVDYDRTYTTVGARLVTRSEEHARFVAEIMLEEYSTWIKK